MQVGEQVRHGDRVRDVGLAGAAALAFMGLEGEVVGFLDALDLGRGQVALELGDQLADADGPSSVRQQAAQGGRDVHGRVLGGGSVSQAELRSAELAHELGFRDEFLRRTIRLLEDLEADVSRGHLAQREHRRLVVLPVERRLGPVRELAARLDATSTSWNRFGTFFRQSSTVMRAMGGLYVSVGDKGRKHSTGSRDDSRKGGEPAPTATLSFCAATGIFVSQITGLEQGG